MMKIGDYEYNPPATPRDWGKFRIAEAPREPGKLHTSLHIVDPDGFVAFTVLAYVNETGAALSHDQDDLWWRAECLVGYFNMDPPTQEEQARFT